jgi:hypothetical protein
MFARVLHLFAALFVSLTSFSSHASFISTDSAFGEHTLIFDEVTGKRWLRMDQTRGMSYNQVHEQLDGAFSGFHIAGSDEVADLFAGIGIPHEAMTYGRPPLAPQFIAHARLTMLQFGAIDSGNHTGLYGFSSFGEPAYQEPETGAWRNLFLEGTGAYQYGNNLAYFDDAVFFYKPSAYSNYGVFLVTAPVPEPETLALMLAGVAGLAAIHRRRFKR